MRAGELKERIKFQRPNVANDPAWGPSDAWADVATGPSREINTRRQTPIRAIPVSFRDSPVKSDAFYNNGSIVVIVPPPVNGKEDECYVSLLLECGA